MVVVVVVVGVGVGWGGGGWERGARTQKIVMMMMQYLLSNTHVQG